MFPLRDTVRSHRFPIINTLLIGINALAFIYELGLSPAGLDRLVMDFGMVPARLQLTNPAAILADPATLVTLFSHMFLHGGWLHFVSNMWTLFIFGDNVEDRLGSGRYLVFYLLGGLVSGLLQAVVSPSSALPAIGASGAIAAVLGAYLVLFPTGRVLTFIPIFILPWLVEIPALIYLGFWFVSQLFSGVAALGEAGMGGVAWWAHIGGFIFGVVAVRIFAPAIHPAYQRRYLPPPDQGGGWQ